MDIKELERIKEEGNALFKKKDLTAAIAAFSNGVNIIEQAQGSNPEYSPELKTLYLQLSTNLALCLLNTSAFTQTITICDNVLKVDADNTKALYRRALSKKGLADELQSKVSDLDVMTQRDSLYSEARKDLERLTSLDPNNKPVKQELSNVVKEAVKIRIALRSLQPNESKGNKDQNSSKQQQKGQDGDAAGEDDEEEVVINKNKKKDIRTNDKYQVVPNFTLEQLNQVSSSAFKTVSNEILSREKPPASSFQFEQEFESLKKESHVLFAYLKSIPPTQYTILYSKTDFPAPKLLSLFNVFSSNAQPEDFPKLLAIITALKDTHKFSLCLMQITKAEKIPIQAFLKTIGATEDVFKAYKLAM